MVSVAWVGQAGFIIETDTTRIGIDLFLTETEGAQPPLTTMDGLGRLDAVCATHEHDDHWDRRLWERLVHRMPNLRAVVPDPLRQAVIQEGFHESSVMAAVPHREIRVGDITIVPVLSSHGVTLEDAYGVGNPPGRFVGYVVKAGGVVLYHSGDTVHYPRMVEEIAPYHVDVALLPINGRDTFREQQGIVGNLTAEEAVELAHRLGAKTLVPMHYDGFYANPGNPEAVVRHARRVHPDLTVVILGYLRPFRLA